MGLRIYEKDEVGPVFARLRKRGMIQPEISSSVRKALGDMDSRGFDALQEYAAKFDGFGLSNDSIRVDKAKIDACAALLTPKQKEAIDLCYARTKAFQEKIATGIKPVRSKNGYGSTSFIPRPIKRVGIYVPGGRAPLPSSLMMAGVSARTAGVKKLVIYAPPRREGVNPAIAYITKKLGITELFLLGGISAIWFMANGIRGICKPVDKICGPGNAYVAEAKSQLAQTGKVGIDMTAGPSEVLVLADGTADAQLIAADLLAQAEHGVNSSAILVTDSETLAKAVQAEAENQLSGMKRKQDIGLALQNCGAIFVVTDLATDGTRIANGFGPEHLEIFCAEENRRPIMRNADCAGAIFIGTGEAFADYGTAGSNHILPTGSSARFSSGLSVQDFIVWTYVNELKQDAQEKLAEKAACFADMESLEAHSNAARMRKR